MTRGLKFNPESLDEALQEAITKSPEFKDKGGANAPTRDVNAYVTQHNDDIVSGLESALAGIIYRMQKPKSPPAKPVLSFDGGKIQLWITDSHQHVKIADHHSQWFGGDETASLIYVERSHGLRSTEYNIDNPSTWAWIQKYMAAGMRALGHMQPEPNTPDLRTAASELAQALATCDRTDASHWQAIQDRCQALRAALEYQPPQGDA